MKGKILAIALSLALLTSLFAFAPVSARTVSNADENAGFFEFTLYFSNFTWVDRTNYDFVWKGGEVEFEGKNVPGHIGMQGECIMRADIHGSFGDGYGFYYWSMETNYVTGRAIEYTVWECFFDDDYQGSFTFLRVHKREFTSWRTTAVDDFRINADTIFRNMTLKDGTGDFENFHFQKKAEVNPNPDGTFPQLTAWGKFTGD